ncbi:MAG: AAA family ATPase [Clostridia bacterium]|nr:AAA family ATPase [Clostridia bacterium]
MRIKSFTVGGFKNLPKTTINLNKSTAIIAINNFGKSNLLEALSFGLEFIYQSPKLRKRLMGYIKGIPLNPCLDSRDFIFEIEFETQSEKSLYSCATYGYSFSWYKDNNSGCKITNEWLKVKENDNSKYSCLIDRSEKKIRKSKKTFYSQELAIDDTQLLIDFIGNESAIDYKDIIDNIKNLTFKLCSSISNEESFIPMPIEYMSNDDSLYESLDHNDIPKALFALKSQSPEKYELFVDSIKTLFPDFSDIVIESSTLSNVKIKKLVISNSETNNEETNTNEDGDEPPFKLRDEYYKLLIKSDFYNQPININRMSAGTQRTFWILANAIISGNASSLMGIEELETSLHPRLLKNLLESLDESMDYTPLIFTSHSPNLIQYLKPEQYYIGIPNPEGVALFKKIAPSKYNKLIAAAQSEGLSVGNFIFELLSGESASINRLNKFLED